MSGSIEKLIESLLSGRTISRRKFLETSGTAVASVSLNRQQTLFAAAPQAASVVVATQPRVWSFDFARDMRNMIHPLVGNLVKLGVNKELLSGSSQKLASQDISQKDLFQKRYQLEAALNSLERSGAHAVQSVCFASEASLVCATDSFEALDAGQEFDTNKYESEYNEWLKSVDCLEYLRKVVSRSEELSGVSGMISARKLQSLFLYGGDKIPAALVAVNERVKLELAAMHNVVSIRCDTYTQIAKGKPIDRRVTLDVGNLNWLEGICEVRSRLNRVLSGGGKNFDISFRLPKDMPDSELAASIIKEHIINILNEEFPDELQIRQAPLRGVLLVEAAGERSVEFMNQLSAKQVTRDRELQRQSVHG